MKTFDTVKRVIALPFAIILVIPFEIIAIPFMVIIDALRLVGIIPDKDMEL